MVVPLHGKNTVGTTRYTLLHQTLQLHIILSSTLHLLPPISTTKKYHENQLMAKQLRAKCLLLVCANHNMTTVVVAEAAATWVHNNPHPTSRRVPIALCQSRRVRHKQHRHVTAAGSYAAHQQRSADLPTAVPPYRQLASAPCIDAVYTKQSPPLFLPAAHTSGRSANIIVPRVK
jgi:hypothetical protein